MVEWRSSIVPRRAAAARGFTLLELLLVLAIISLVISILLPALSNAREQGRLALCVSNVRGQGSVLHSYTVDYQGNLPPRLVKSYFSGAAALINVILAEAEQDPFPPPPEGQQFAFPPGIWRCPDVERENDRSTPDGYLHYAPNRWLFNSIVSYGEEDSFVSADAPPGWESRYGTSEWRHVEQVTRPSEIVSFIDNIRFIRCACGEQHAYQSVGYSQDMIGNPDDPVFLNRQYSHERLAKRPAAFVDGHAEALPISRAYWYDSLASYHPLGNPAITVQLYHREVQHFMWFIGPGEYIGAGL